MVGELYIILCWYMFTDLFLTQIESVFSLTDFENCSCQLFQSIFMMDRYVQKDIRPGWVKSEKIAKLRARTIS